MRTQTYLRLVTWLFTAEDNHQGRTANLPLQEPCLFSFHCVAIVRDCKKFALYYRSAAIYISINFHSKRTILNQLGFVLAKQ